MGLNMVNVEQVVPVMNRTNIHGNKSLEIGTAFFEAGMVEVLKDIAVSQMDRQNHYQTLENSKTVVDTRLECEAAYQNLFGQLTPEQQNLLEKFDDQWAGHASALEGDQFIAGFIHGYAFLKTLYRP